MGIISASGGLIREIGVRSEQVGEVSWSPDGNYIGFVTQGHMDRRITNRMDRKVNVASVDRTGREEVFEHSEGVSWAPEGRYLAFIEENNGMGIKRKVWLLDMKTWQRIQLLASRENIRQVSWLSGRKMGLTAPVKVPDTESRIRGWILSLRPLPE